MKIDILLPYKEKFSKNFASAVSLTVKNAMEHSKYLDHIKVYGQKVTNPFYINNFFGIKNNWILHGGHNKSLAYNFYKVIIKSEHEKRILELHNRPYIFNYLYKKLQNFPMTLHFHNDPQTMKGSATVKEREFIANKASAVYFVSEFIKNKFTEGLSKKFDNLYIINNGIQRKLIQKPLKKKEVLFVGRIVPEKGAYIYVQSIKKIINNFKQWKFIIIGAGRAGQRKMSTKFEKSVIDEFNNLGQNTEYFGFIDNELVQKKIADASILVVPSIWEEPFALVAIEGLCNAAAVISSSTGGLPEVIEDNGILIDNINEKILSEKLSYLLRNQKLIEEFQNKAWNNYKFNISGITQKQDLIREEIFNKFYK